MNSILFAFIHILLNVTQKMCYIKSDNEFIVHIKATAHRTVKWKKTLTKAN